MTLKEQIEADDQWVAETFHAKLEDIARRTPAPDINRPGDFQNIAEHYANVFRIFVLPSRENEKVSPKVAWPTHLANLKEFKKRYLDVSRNAQKEFLLEAAGLRVPLLIREEIIKAEKKVAAESTEATTHALGAFAPERATTPPSPDSAHPKSPHQKK